ncbi:RNA-binding protein [Aerococcus urinaehominis]|uniref:RNA-binding protein n=1 Tax=Aerococcus urinaehominis TaxID=128944 RepID=A0A0X8FLR6_9LACT|nr:ribosome assembly RNA-binding protein YhbY [Aerococcus urinaehominis]AMB99646.1 RNA-binding protein [Aerococcus urinaehominis]SDL88809.1 RNA-binding protein [Aerococcus urinaehominis]
MNNKQKKYLLKEAHQLKAIFQIGKAGLNEELINQISQALEKRELIKVAILQNSLEDVDEASQVIGDQVQADFVNTIGHTIILYRASRQEKNRRYSPQVKSLG